MTLCQLVPFFCQVDFWGLEDDSVFGCGDLNSNQ